MCGKAGVDETGRTYLACWRSGTVITYRKTRAGNWAVCGPVEQMHIGPVAVTKRNGGTKSEMVVKLGTPFIGDDGQQYVCQLPRPNGRGLREGPSSPG
jgi:hypothetical protein